MAALHLDEHAFIGIPLALKLFLAVLKIALICGWTITIESDQEFWPTQDLCT